MFHCWGSAEIQSLGAVQCEVFNWICLAADHAHEIISCIKLKNGNLITAESGGGNSEWSSRGKIHWCSLCSSGVSIKSYRDHKVSVSDGPTFYRLNTMKVNCHNSGLDPCDLVHEANGGILHYPCCALKWAGCCFWGSSQQLFVIVLLLKETKINSLKALGQIVLL